jgi:hypothetical protein
VPSAKQRWLILVSALVIVGFQVGLFYAMQRFQSRKPDFASLYQAGRKLDHQRFPSLIDRFPSLKSVEYSVQIDGHDFDSDNLHPPYEMLIYASLALLKFRISYLVWWAFNLGCLFLCMFILWFHAPKLQSSYPYLLIIVATFFPVLVSMVQGQNSVLLLEFLTLCFGSFEKNHDFRAGFALAMGMFKFVIVIPLAFWLILERRWRSLAGFLCGCVALFFVALWLVRMEGIFSYLGLLTGFGRKAPEQPGTEGIMPNLRGLLHLVGSGVVPEIWIAAITLLASIALLIWVDLRLSQYKNMSLRFATQVLLACMISYHLYPHDSAVLVLPFLLLLNHALEDAAGKTFRIAVLTCTICAYLVPFVAGLYVGMPVIGATSLALMIFARSEALKNPVMSTAHARS